MFILTLACIACAALAAGLIPGAWSRFMGSDIASDI
jgi:hypothetical protein